ncbi:putative pectinesterase 11 [Cryptomeria japonica]|uniref:putative pectinesterase 11 n=1 Tax=Cryptomeria japonica TaxID=3369 RepID=UPI0027DA84A6|nr:putative pectinesterase 11 [Cryptomeria japonica]
MKGISTRYKMQSMPSPITTEILEKVTIPIDKSYRILSDYNANNTIITWNDNAEASRIYSCGALIVFVSDFVARYITIENSYEPDDNPIVAVAIRVPGDKSTFYNRGVDLICGNGQSLYEKCLLHTIPRQNGAIVAQRRNISGEATGLVTCGQNKYFGPGSNIERRVPQTYNELSDAKVKCHLHTIPRQNGAIAAQRSNASGEATRFVFLSCKVTGGGLIYLGRAWGYYSTIIFAFTYMDNIIIPQGRDDWNDPRRQKLVTCGQNKCSGPDSNIERRVPWAYNELSDVEAAPFLINQFC